MAVPPQATPSQSDRKVKCVVLGVDYGRKRIGLAVSDEIGLTARPLTTWLRTNRRRDIARLRELCRLYDVSKIVVGWPLHLDGTAGDMAREAGRFAERLHKHLGLPVELVDERLSSWEAGRVIAESSTRGRATFRRKASLDEFAAALILRDYLSHANATVNS